MEVDQVLCKNCDQSFVFKIKRDIGKFLRLSTKRILYGASRVVHLGGFASVNHLGHRINLRWKLIIEYPQADSNRCCRRERPVS